MLLPREVKEMRSLRKEFKKNGGIIFHAVDSGVCLAMQRTGENMGIFSAAIMGNDEAEFSKNQGEYWALIRFMINNERTPFVWPKGEGFYCRGYVIANAIGHDY